MANRLSTMLAPGNRGWMNQTDILLGIGVISVVAMLIIPLPVFLLDFFLIISLMLGILVLLIVMFVPRSYDFSVFPSLLLMTTVFRLALNVSSTRLILLNGAGFDGKVIRTFGQFVVGGNYVVGFIVFIVLVAVQFMVITKGATRTAEVAARFTLDAMPVKMMGIENELANGSITEEEAARKKRDVRTEADFFGSMDGASKFVQGDVKVGIVILLINVIGGFIIGMTMRGESFDVALKTYTLLTIGDGLVNQIPSLMITTATGIIVTRAVSDESLGKDLKNQLGSEPKALFITSGFLFVMMLIPGFPKFALLFISIGLGALGYILMEAKKDETVKEKLATEDKAKKEQKPTEIPVVTVDPLEVEIGYNLIPLVDPEQGGSLLERITNIRRQSALQMGLIVPPIRIRDNIELDASSYSILIKGVEIGSGVLESGKLMAMDAGEVTEKIEGAEFTEPAFGLRAIWIDTDKRDLAERRGYTVVDCPTIIATHLTEIIKRHADEILGRQEVKQIIDNIRNEYPAVIEELMASKGVGYGDIQKVLQNLLRERVSIRNMVTILETMATYIDYVQKDMGLLTEYVRVALARQICRDYTDGNKNMSVITVDPQIEAIIRNSIHDDPVEGKVVGLDPETHSQVMDSIVNSFGKAREQGVFPVYLVSPQIRSVLFALLEREIPEPVVLSYNEIPADIRVNVALSAMLG